MSQYKGHASLCHSLSAACTQLMTSSVNDCRPDEDRNAMERLTLASLQHLPTAMLFVVDLTEGCGTSVGDQRAIRWAGVWGCCMLERSGVPKQQLQAGRLVLWMGGSGFSRGAGCTCAVAAYSERCAAAAEALHGQAPELWPMGRSCMFQALLRLEKLLAAGLGNFGWAVVMVLAAHPRTAFMQVLQTMLAVVYVCALYCPRIACIGVS